MTTKKLEWRVEFEKGINEKSATELLDFIWNYLEKFNDPIMRNKVDRAIAIRRVDKTFIEMAKKRKENFSQDEINNPLEGYCPKYRRLLTRMISRLCEDDGLRKDNEILADMLKFYITWGYLTSKQKGFASFLTKGTTERATELSDSTREKISNIVNDLVLVHISPSVFKTYKVDKTEAIIALRNLIPEYREILESGGGGRREKGAYGFSFPYGRGERPFKDETNFEDLDSDEEYQKSLPELELKKKPVRKILTLAEWRKRLIISEDSEN